MYHQPTLKELLLVPISTLVYLDHPSIPINHAPIDPFVCQTSQYKLNHHDNFANPHSYANCTKTATTFLILLASNNSIHS